jgi:hypothetical protein
MLPLSFDGYPAVLEVERWSAAEKNGERRDAVPCQWYEYNFLGGAQHCQQWPQLADQVGQDSAVDVVSTVARAADERYFSPRLTTVKTLLSDYCTGGQTVRSKYRLQSKASATLSVSNLTDSSLVLQLL